MMIAVDIGNTNVTWGIFEEGRPHPPIKMPTAVLSSRTQTLTFLRAAFNASVLEMFRGKDIYACSVVPSLNEALRGLARTFFGAKFILVGQDVAIPILNRYRIPSQVGTDRLVNAYAGLKIYGPGLIIVDFGTAVTFDIVSKKSEYLGGLILPGFRLMQESLNRNTALLPYARLARPMEIVGKDTVSSIRAGLVYGMTGACDGVIERLLKKDAKGFRVVATGGDAALVRPHSKYFKIFEESLVLKGLELIAKSQIQQAPKKNS
jgi:type III pantothenate kinase